MWVAVQRDRSPDTGGLFENRFNIQRIRLARQQQPPGWMRQNRQMRIVQRGQYALRHRVTIHAESRVDRPDDVIESVENVGVVIDSTICQNIRRSEEHTSELQ